MKSSSFSDLLLDTRGLHPMLVFGLTEQDIGTKVITIANKFQKIKFTSMKVYTMKLNKKAILLGTQMVFVS